MSEPLSKTELVRAAWLVELRRQGGRQCADYYCLSTRKVCALGLLLEVASEDDEPDVWEAGALAGLDSEQSQDVANRNDGALGYHKHSFAEIADVVEGWFK